MRHDEPIRPGQEHITVNGTSKPNKRPLVRLPLVGAVAAAALLVLILVYFFGERWLVSDNTARPLEAPLGLLPFTVAGLLLLGGWLVLVLGLAAALLRKRPVRLREARSHLLDPTEILLLPAIGAVALFWLLVMGIFGIPLALIVLAGEESFAPLIIEALVLYYTGLVFVLMNYHYVRQGELLYVMLGAAQTKQPLPPSLRAYLGDRPRSPWRHLADAVLLTAVFPGYWFWHHMSGFDAKVGRLIGLLDTGMPLSGALRQVRGVSAPETVLAASVGEATGKLDQTLQQAPKWRLATIWFEMAPRLLYPLWILATSAFIATFLCIYIMPKFEEIFRGFGLPLPAITVAFLHWSRWLIAYGLEIFLVPLAVALLFIFSPTLRWYTPVLGHFSRMHARSRVLKMLGLLLQTGQPVPQALRVLLGTGYFWGPVRSRLATVCRQVEQGRELSAAMHAHGLLPASMVPLVQAAIKLQNLPWALEELGELQARRTAAAVERFCMGVFPICIMLVAVVVAFMAISVFLPLVALLETLREAAAPQSLLGGGELTAGYAL